MLVAIERLTKSYEATIYDYLCRIVKSMHRNTLTHFFKFCASRLVSDAWMKVREITLLFLLGNVYKECSRDANDVEKKTRRFAVHQRLSGKSQAIMVAFKSRLLG